MKWNKFEAILDENPWLRGFVGSSKVISALNNYPADKAKAMLKEWVRTRINFVAFRPFESLNILETNMRNGNGPDYTWVHYKILLHIEGEAFAYRARSVAWDVEEDEDETSIRKVIEHLITWHQLYWAKQGKGLIFDAVIKETGNETSRSLEIFRFPEGFSL
ncbi:hypothetical protein ACFL2U_00400 [Patescibacteria group bacterium]